MRWPSVRIGFPGPRGSPRQIFDADHHFDVVAGERIANVDNRPEYQQDIRYISGSPCLQVDLLLGT